MSTTFEQIHLALAQLDRLASGHLDPATLEGILRERRSKLAARSRKTATREVAAEVVAVERAGQRLGFPIASVQEVRLVRATRLPHATPFVLGLFPLRGRILCLVDLAPFFGVADPLPESGETLALVVASEGRVLGLRVDAVTGARTVYRDACRGGDLGRTGFTTLITDDLLAVVEPGALLDRRELQIRTET